MEGVFHKYRKNRYPTFFPPGSEPTADSSTTKHSPEYKDFLFGGTVTLYVGPKRKKMEIHKKLLASISPELNKHVNNDMREGIEGILCLPDDEEEVLTLFTQWAYTGDYAYKSTAQKSPQDPEDLWPSLHKHLQLCVFADKFNIQTLKQLAESRFHTELNPIEPRSERDADGLVVLIDYAYDNLPSSHPIPKFLAQYASWKLGLLRATTGLNKLILAQPAFLQEFLLHLNGLEAKPVTPEWYLPHHGFGYGPGYGQYQSDWYV